MKSRTRKKIQRKVNRTVRLLNNDVRDDDLWRGRFIMRQKDARWSLYDDGSGGELFVLIEATDLKTGLKQEKWLNAIRSFSWVFDHQCWRFMNDFIVDEVDVWRAEKPYKGEDHQWRS